MSEKDVTVYRAVVNDEGQYSIWPSGKDLPFGWRDAGETGMKADVLQYIEMAWKDLRPMSVRRRMEDALDERSACK